MDNPVQEKKSKEELIQEIAILKDIIKELENKPDNYFKLLFERAPLPYQSLDSEGHILEVNQAWLEKMGYKKKEAIGRWFGDFISKKEHGVFAERFPCFKSLGIICGVEFTMRRKDGTTFSASLEGRIGKDKKGNFKQTHCIFTDITERNKLKDKLINEQKKYQDLYDNAPAMFVSVDHESGNVLECNKTLVEKTGYSKKEIIGCHILERYHESSLKDAKAAFESFLTTGIIKNAELALKKKDGGKINVILNVTSVKDEKGNILNSRSVWQDITERNKAEKMLRDSEALLRALNEYSLNAIAFHKVILNDQGEVIDYIFLQVNKMFEQLTGLVKADILGKKVTEVIPGIENEGLIEKYGEVALTGNPIRFEQKVEAMGKWFDIAAYSTKKGYFAVTFDDVTERKIVRKELEDIFNFSPDMMCVSNLEGKIMKVNPAWKRILGYTIDEVLELGWEKLVHPDDKKDIDEQVDRQQKGLEIKNFVNRFRCKDSTYKTFEWQARPSEDGMIHATARDITERKTTEKRMQNLAKFPEENPAPVMRIAKEGRVLYANKGADCLVDLWGCRQGTCADNIIIDIVNTALKTGKQEIKEVSAGNRTFSLNIVPIIDAEYVNLYARDITERKKSEELLKNEKLLNEEYINSLPGLFYVFDEERFVQWNKQWNVVTGYSGGELSKMYGTDFFDGHGKTLIAERMKQVFVEGFADAEAELVTKQGKRIPYYFTGSLKEIGGKTHLVGLGIDITERKKAEQETKNFAKIFDESLNEIYIFDPENLKFVYVNKGAQKNIGYSLQEMKNLTPLDLKKEVSEEEFLNIIAPLKNKETDVIRFKTKHFRKDGSFYYVNAHLQIAKYHGKEHFLAMILDITEQEKAKAREKDLIAERIAANAAKQKATELMLAYQELKDTQMQLIQAEKLAGIGQLGAGIAHELNSPLTGVLSLLRSYKGEKDPSSIEHADLGEMEKACLHMADIIKSLNVFSRQSTDNFEIINCNEAIEATLSFSGYHFKRGALKIEKNFKKNLYEVKVNKNQIQQVIVNMITNACDAMPVKGIFTITTRNLDNEKGNWVEMEFADTGSGITQENVDKIFDPFFTTKRPGGGVGLGLSIAHKIIENHKGLIKVKSKPGEGTVFKVRLPACKESENEQS